MWVKSNREVPTTKNSADKTSNSVDKNARRLPIKNKLSMKNRVTYSNKSDAIIRPKDPTIKNTLNAMGWVNSCGFLNKEPRIKHANAAISNRWAVICRGILHKLFHDTKKKMTLPLKKHNDATGELAFTASREIEPATNTTLPNTKKN